MAWQNDVVMEHVRAAAKCVLADELEKIGRTLAMARELYPHRDLFAARKMSLWLSLAGQFPLVHIERDGMKGEIKWVVCQYQHHTWRRSRRRELTLEPSVDLTGNAALAAQVIVEKLRTHQLYFGVRGWVPDGMIPFDKLTVSSLQRAEAVALRGYTERSRLTDRRQERAAQSAGSSWWSRLTGSGS